MAYFLVHSRANSLYLSRSVLYIRAISGTSGSSGFGSHSNEQIDRRTGNCQDQISHMNLAFAHYLIVIKNRFFLQKLPFEMVNAGDHWDRNMSRHIEPLELMFGW